MHLRDFDLRRVGIVIKALVVPFISLKLPFVCVCVLSGYRRGVRHRAKKIVTSKMLSFPSVVCIMLSRI